MGRCLRLLMSFWAQKSPSSQDATTISHHPKRNPKPQETKHQKNKYLDQNPRPKGRLKHTANRHRYPSIGSRSGNKTLNTPPIRNQLRINPRTPQLRLISNLILPFPTRSTITNPHTNRT